jgi:hypothetical protein
VKKFFFIWLLLVYGISSSGMSIYITYCCDEVQDISMTRQNEMPCSDEDADPCLDNTTNCCYIGQVSAELNTEQQVENIFKTLTVAAWASTAAPGSNLHLIHQLGISRQEMFPPPLIHKPLFDLYCSYRI